MKTPFPFLFVVIGAGLGTVIGVVFGFLALAISLGTGLGLLVGIVMMNSQKQDPTDYQKND